jgi:ubiquinone/menaquinone biosynthesis C-methylase UbiE
MKQPFHDHFSAVANRYADFRPHYPPELFNYLATLVPLDALVWDCAAGNGQATVDLAKRFQRVVATDASAEQIASATPHSGVEFRVAPAEESGLPDESAGLITVAQALHWFDLEKFYAEADRVLTPGGILAVWAYGINVVEGDEANAVVQDFYGHTLDEYWPPQRRLVESGYRTIPFPFHELEAPAFRMETRWTLDQLMGYFSTWSAVNRYIKVNGRNPVEHLTETLRPLWGNAETARQIVWPLSMRVSRKQR